VEAGYHEQLWPFEMLAEIGQEKDILFWRIVDGKGRIVLADVSLEDVPEDERYALPANASGSDPVLLPGAQEGAEVWLVPMRMRTGFEPWTFQLGFSDLRARQHARGVILANTLAVFAVAALLIPLLLVGTRRLLRPLVSLTRAAEKMELGDLDVSLPRASGDEIGQLVKAFGAMASSVKTRDTKIKEKIQELREANDRTRQAQAELVQSEKMSMLGELAAGVAHEINSPTGAILNVSADVADHLERLVMAEMRVADMPEPTRRWLIEVMPTVLSAEHVVGSEASVRSGRRQMQNWLRDAGCADHRRIAGVIVNCKLTGMPPAQELMEHLSHEPVVSLLEHLIALRTSADICLGSGRKIARIVRALRSYARTGPDELAEVDINESIDNTLVILQNRIKRTAQVSVSFGDGLPAVKCGPEISQVWTNILNNACDAIEASPEEKMGLVEVTTRAERQGVAVEISNGGPVIPPAIVDKIYEPFFTTKPAGKGTGLGLGICTGIVERAGGAITLINEPGRVAFVVWLPGMPQASPGSRAPDLVPAWVESPAGISEEAG
jgi:C4-dicarboxylate-specific signal transduction histidine kinase